MAIKYEAVVKGASYTDKSGQEKSSWIRVGTVFENEKGQLSMKLESLPVGNPDWTGFINFFEPKPREQQRTQTKRAAFDDDDPVPF